MRRPRRTSPLAAPEAGLRQALPQTPYNQVHFRRRTPGMERFALPLRFAALALAASLAAPALAHEETHHHHDHSHDDGRGDWARNYITLGVAEGSNDCNIEHRHENLYHSKLRHLYEAGASESYCPARSFAASYGHRFHRNWGLEVGQIRSSEVETDGDRVNGRRHHRHHGTRYYQPYEIRPVPYRAESEATTTYAAVTFFFGGSTGFQPYLMAGKARREFVRSSLYPIPNWNGEYEGHFYLRRDEIEIGEVPIRGLGAVIGLGKRFGLRVSYKELPDQDIDFYGTEFSFSF